MIVDLIVFKCPCMESVRPVEMTVTAKKSRPIWCVVWGVVNYTAHPTPPHKPKNQKVH